MIRNVVLAIVLLPCLAVTQGVAKVQKDRAKVLDGAAMTPFFTQKGADAVKRVIAGADARKEDEKATDPLDGKAAKPGQAAPLKFGPNGLPIQGNPAPQQQAPPPPDAPFTWRLIGISYGKRQGMALFQANGVNKTVWDGSDLDSDTKIVSVSRSRVVIVFHGKRLELSPW
jgi:hypothetical protein